MWRRDLNFILKAVTSWLLLLWPALLRRIWSMMIHFRDPRYLVSSDRFPSFDEKRLVYFYISGYLQLDAPFGRSLEVSVDQVGANPASISQ